MIKLNLKVKDEENKTSTEQYEIEEMNMMQFEDTMEVIGSVMLLAQDNESLQSLLTDTFASIDDESEVTVAGEEFVSNILGSLDLLLMTIPSKVSELLSSASGIELNVFRQQKIDTVFDIFDAVIKENDVKKIIQRGKQSFELTKSQMTVTKNTKPKAVPTMTKQA